MRLHRIGVRPGDLLQQYPVGRYRLDFADPDVLIAIEADGFFHRMPGAAERDRKRDEWLLSQGWFLFRISDGSDSELEERLCAAVILIRDERRRRDLPIKRTNIAAWKKAQPSQLAVAHGYRPPPEAA